MDPTGPDRTRADFVGDPHGPNGVSRRPEPQKSPCGPGRAGVVEFSYYRLLYFVLSRRRCRGLSPGRSSVTLQLRAWNLAWRSRPKSVVFFTPNFIPINVSICSINVFHFALATAALVASADSLSPTAVIGGACSQSPECGEAAARSLALSTSDGALRRIGLC